MPHDYEALATRLRAAEDQVFPLVMVDTDRYQRAVTLIGHVMRYLEETAHSLADLEQGHAVAVTHAREIASRQAIAIADLDLDVVVDAAMSQRFRSLLLATTQDRVEARIEEARAAGLAWATVSEPDAATLGTSPSQEWVEVHVATGARLVRTISMRPETGEPLFRVALVTPEGEESAVDCPDRDSWLAHADELRRESP